MLLIGLTGGIASGKTLVSDAFESLGVPVIDADVLARVAVEPESDGLKQLSEHFGSQILTKAGELDRAALRHIIFSDSDQRKKVDSILHPIIRALSENRISAAEKLGHPYAIYAVPLLVETKQQDRFDRILVIDVPVEVQLHRLQQRDGGTEEKARAIIDAQASREERLAIADDVIDNSGTMDAVQTHVAELHTRYLEIAKSAASKS